MESRKLRVCMSISCVELDGAECKLDECEHSDLKKELDDRRKKLLEVKLGKRPN